MKTDDDASSLTRGQRRARTFYAAAGILAIAAAVMALLGPFQGWLNGCDLFTSQEALDGLGAGGDQAMESSCAYYLDLVGIGAPLLLGIVLAGAAWRYLRTDALSTTLTALAILAGLVVGSVPAYTVWWLIDYYRLSIGPTEIMLIVIAAGLLGLALYAGWMTAVSLGRQRGGRLE
jgi:ABC-type Fe3+-siderophore transport system permease subunit